MSELLILERKTTTNRVDAAKKLRGSGDRLFGNSFGGGSVKATEIIRASIDVAYDYDELFDHLADLIDPTCHNKQIEINKMVPLEFRTDNLICSNCGETFCADPDGINAPIDWAYCPNCGYRIVETNSGEDNNSER